MTGAAKIFLIAVAVGAYSLIKKAKGLTNLVFYPKSLKGFHFDGITPVLTFGLAIQNVNNQSFTLKSMAGKIFSNNFLIGNVSTFTPQVVHANAETIVYIDARLSPIGIVSDIMHDLESHTFSHTMELEAVANVDNLQIPIDIKYKFGK